MLIGFFTFEVVVFDGSNHILSEGDVAANVVTLEAFTVKFVPSTIHGVVNDSRGSLIIVFSIKAPRTRIRSLCARPAHGRSDAQRSRRPR